MSDTTSPAEIGQQTFPDEWNQQDLEIPLEAQLSQQSHSHTYTPTAQESPTAQERGLAPQGSAPQQSTCSTTPSNPAANEGALRRSMREAKAPERLIEIFETEIERTNRHYVAYEVLAQPVDIEPDINYIHPAIAFAASSNPDIMYFHEAMRQPDQAQFLKAAVKEIDDQTENGNWRVI